VSPAARRALRDGAGARMSEATGEMRSDAAAEITRGKPAAGKGNASATGRKIRAALDGFGFRVGGQKEVGEGGGGGGHGESSRWAKVWGSATAEWRGRPAAVWECDCAECRTRGRASLALA
jgi:hypothetical protein